MLSAAASSLLRSGATKTLTFTRVTTRASRPVFFSSGSHDDFAPKRKVVANEDEAINMIKVCIQLRRIFDFETKEHNFVGAKLRFLFCRLLL